MTYNKSDWRHKKTLWSNGRALILVPNHPFARKSGHMLRSRLAVEEFLDRFLTSKETVHHRNGDKTDDRIENLFVFSSNGNHMKYHRKKKQMVEVKLTQLKPVSPKEPHYFVLPERGFIETLDLKIDFWNFFREFSKTLSSRDFSIFADYYVDELTLQDIGDKKETSKQRVQQLLEKIQAKATVFYEKFTEPGDKPTWPKE